MSIFPYFRDFVWGTPVIPDLYWNAYSYEERIKQLCMEYGKLIAYLDDFAEDYNVTKEDVDELKETFEKFKKSGFDDYYKEQIIKWIDSHLSYIYEHTAKQVYFGLTEDGYFCAYIPESWNDITFDTGAVYGRSDYGHLILRFDASGEGVVDNTYSQTVAQDTAAQLKADLEYVQRTLFTNLDEVVTQ